MQEPEQSRNFADLLKTSEPELVYQPVNRATHECLRGPCRHFWEIVARLDSNIGDSIQLKRMIQCNAHCEAMELGEENIYRCTFWWPEFLSFVPKSVQAILRPYVRKLYEHWLSAIGYDFSWKHWPSDAFRKDDRKDNRSNCSPV